jgi:hypothetical protein
MGADEAGKVTKPCEQRHAVLRRLAACTLMDWIQHDPRYLALGLELIVGVGRPKFERLLPNGTQRFSSFSTQSAPNGHAEVTS